MKNQINKEMLMNKNGFTAIETLLAIIALLLIGFLSTYIYNSITDNKESLEIQTVQEDQTPESADSSAGVQDFENKEGVEEGKPEVNMAADIDFSSMAYEMTFPQGWKLEETVEIDNPCVEDGVEARRWRTDIFVNTTGHSIEVLENTGLNGCGGDQNPDVLLDYDFNAEGIVVDDGEIILCSSESNPFCPDQNDFINVWVVDMDDSDFTSTALNGNLYNFKAAAGEVEKKKEERLRELVDIIKTIQFKQIESRQQ
jgi:hypothetical protein